MLPPDLWTHIIHPNCVVLLCLSFIANSPTGTADLHCSSSLPLNITERRQFFGVHSFRFPRCSPPEPPSPPSSPPHPKNPSKEPFLQRPQSLTPLLKLSRSPPLSLYLRGATPAAGHKKVPFTVSRASPTPPRPQAGDKTTRRQLP